MAIFKRGRIYWYHFLFNGQHVQQSTKQGNPRVARQMEADLARGRFVSDSGRRNVTEEAIEVAGHSNSIPIMTRLSLDRRIERQKWACSACILSLCRSNNPES